MKRRSGIDRPARFLQAAISAARILAIMVFLLPCIAMTASCDLNGVQGDSHNSNFSYICILNADCTNEQICIEGVCVADRESSLVVSIQTSPPHMSGLKWQGFHNLPVSLERPMADLVLRPTMTVKGRILALDNPLSTGIPARIVASAHGPNVGSPWRTEARAESGREFTLSLLPGTYDLAIFPDNNELPPHRETIQVNENGMQHDVYLPAQHHYEQVTGKCVIGPGDTQGISGLRIQAFSQGGTYLSTVDVTDIEGLFQLTLPPGRRDYTFRVSQTDQTLFYPTVDFRSLDFTNNNQVILPLGGGGNQVTVAGRLVDDEDNSVQNAMIEFESNIGNGTYFRSAMSSTNGKFLVELLPGNYNIRIIPSIDGPMAITKLSGVAIPSNNTTLAPITLNTKSLINGRILNPVNNQPVEGVSVEAFLTATTPNGDMGLHRTVLSQSQADGTFGMWVDPGLYLMTFLPPVGTGLPRWTEKEVNLPQSAYGTFREFILKEPTVVYGRIVGPQRNPLAGTTVEVYASEEGMYGRTNTDSDSKAILIGSGITNEEGWYRIILPSI